MHMKKNQIAFLSMAAFVISALTFVSCSDDDPAPAPVADFTLEIDDKTVTFTNTSTNATTYSWDFGDNTLSTDMDPVHTYDAYGDYDVRLTAKGDGGEVIKKQTISVIKEWPAIAIDGDFTDWADVPTFYTGGVDNGALAEAKVSADGAAYLYVYLKKTSLTAPVLEMFINSDNDLTTGWDATQNLWLENDGSDFSLEIVAEEFNDGEGDVAIGSSNYIFNPSGDVAWPWDGDYTEGDVDQISGYVGNEIEFRVPYSAFPGMSNEQIGIYFMVLDNTWTDIGWLPAFYQDPLLNASFFSLQ